MIVSQILRFKTFRDMFKVHDVSDVLPHKHTVKEGINLFYGFGGYKRKEKEYGVVSFTLSPLTTTTTTMPTTGTESESERETDIRTDNSGVDLPTGKKISHAKKRRIEESIEKEEEEPKGYYDMGRPRFRKRFGNNSLPNGNNRTCGQDALVTAAKLLGINLTKKQTYESTLPKIGDTKTKVLIQFGQSVGLHFDCLRDHKKWKQHYLWMLPGGPEHNLLLSPSGIYFTCLSIHLGPSVDKHVVVLDLHNHEINGTVYCGMIIDNHGPVKLIEFTDLIWLGKPDIPPVRLILKSIFPRSDRVCVRNVYKLSKK